jgi:regulator of replication initiation timing
MKKGLGAFLVVALALATIFIGCSTIPKEELDAKEAMIQKLHAQIDALKQELNGLGQSNDELVRAQSDLKERLRQSEAEKMRLQNALESKSATQTKTEAEIK